MQHVIVGKSDGLAKNSLKHVLRMWLTARASHVLDMWLTEFPEARASHVLDS
jgi:hypothetical protein